MIDDRNTVWLYPGYLAYRVLTKARPAGSVNQLGELFLADGRLCLISWKRPDGQTAYALWSPRVHPPKAYWVSW